MASRLVWLGTCAYRGSEDGLPRNAEDGGHLLPEPLGALHCAGAALPRCAGEDSALLPPPQKCSRPSQVPCSGVRHVGPFGFKLKHRG